jgi:carbamoyl-phosphate synthase large subunit
VGYRFVATPGTAAALRSLGHEVREAALLGTDDSSLPSILDVIASGDISLVINTPAPRSGAVLDAAAIRHAAVAEGILCLTDIDTAVAAAHSLEPSAQARTRDVRSLDRWLATAREPASGSRATYSRPG